MSVYLLRSLPVRVYALTFSKDGFQTQKCDRIELSAGQVRVIDVALAVCVAATQIQVTREAPPLQPNNAEIGIVIDQNQVSSLPLKRL